MPTPLKIKIGGLMFMTTDIHAVGPKGRTERMIPLIRKTFGDQMALYADANGFYSVEEAIRVGKLLEEYRYGFFEEPVMFDWHEETKQVADALSLPIALGEQEYSLHGFRWLIANDAVQIVQPDNYYFGGMIRSMQVARMAAAFGKSCTPHMSGGGLGFLYMMHFVSVLPNAHAASRVQRPWNQRASSSARRRRSKWSMAKSKSQPARAWAWTSTRHS